MDDVRTWQVPGRVNLIGEHLDYNGGPSLPFAIDRFLTLKARRRDDHTINAWTTLPDGRRDRASWSADDDRSDEVGWRAYVAGAARAVRDRLGRSVGADLVLESDLPVGAGLSSSAALTVGVCAAMNDLAGGDLRPLDLARLGQQTENDAGTPTGLMDQLTVVFGQEGHAVLTRPLSDEPVERLVPWDPAAAGLALLVIDTGASHSLAESGYGDRRRECEQAAEALGVEHLAAAGLQALVGLQDPLLQSRARHVFTEAARVTAALRAIGDGSWEQLGTVLTASHASLRDDFEVSAPELDVAVEAALEAGALGARMTGGGFGGSAIALVPQAKAGPVRELVEQRYDSLGWKAPTVFAVRPAPGLRRLS